MDIEILDIANAHSCVASRYSDDIFVSSSEARFPLLLARLQNSKIKFGKSLRKVFGRSGFKINLQKLRLTKRIEWSSITGLLVGDRLNVPKEFRRAIRAALDQWNKAGILTAARSHPKGTPDAFVASLRGRIERVGQVRGKDDLGYQSLLASFLDLSTRDLS